MANIPSYEEMQKLIKEFAVPILKKLAQLKRQEDCIPDVYTDELVIDKARRDINQNMLTHLGENRELPVKKIQGTRCYRGTNRRRLFILFNPD